MDRSAKCTLISMTYSADSIGQMVETETQKEIFCSVSSVSRAEFYDAGRNGLSPEYRLVVFSPEYNGEDELIYNGIRYGIIRAYVAKNERTELTIARKTGVFEPVTTL